jgi:hypothetical protein
MQNWSKGVELELHGVGRYRTVKSTEDAAQCLLAYWPRWKGRAYIAAQQACLNALDGIASPEIAREAFIGAALAAKIHIRSTTDPRQQAMEDSARRNKLIGTDSPAFRKANREAVASIKKIVEKYQKGGPNAH